MSMEPDPSVLVRQLTFTPSRFFNLLCSCHRSSANFLSSLPMDWICHFLIGWQCELPLPPCPDVPPPLAATNSFDIAKIAASHWETLFGVRDVVLNYCYLLFGELDKRFAWGGSSWWGMVLRRSLLKREASALSLKLREASGIADDCVTSR